MIRIKALIVAGGVFSAAIAVAGDLSTAIAVKSSWPCGASLLPCRTGVTARPQTLPYWRGGAPEQPIRASYRPAFARTKR